MGGVPPPPTTLSPSLQAVTPLPTAAIVPQNSCPMTEPALNWPYWKRCTSEPHIAQYLTFTRTCPGPGCGSGTSSTDRRCFPLKTAAFIVPPLGCARYVIPAKAAIQARQLGRLARVSGFRLGGRNGTATLLATPMRSENGGFL